VIALAICSDPFSIIHGFSIASATHTFDTASSTFFARFSVTSSHAFIVCSPTSSHASLVNCSVASSATSST
jgi:hypothetical protein